MTPNSTSKSSELLRLPTPPPSAALLWPASGASLPSPLASPAAALAAAPPSPNVAAAATSLLLPPYTCSSCQRQILDKVRALTPLFTVHVRRCDLAFSRRTPH